MAEALAHEVDRRAQRVYLIRGGARERRLVDLRLDRVEARRAIVPLCTNAASTWPRTGRSAFSTDPFDARSSSVTPSRARSSR
ncbi:MAG: hypothetical protein ABI585_14895 [Betaproteobacteria bacterium]